MAVASLLSTQLSLSLLGKESSLSTLPCPSSCTSIFISSLIRERLQSTGAFPCSSGAMFQLFTSGKIRNTSRSPNTRWHGLPQISRHVVVVAFFCFFVPQPKGISNLRDLEARWCIYCNVRRGEASTEREKLVSLSRIKGSSSDSSQLFVSPCSGIGVMHSGKHF